MALPYMPLYIGDYLRDTNRLSAQQHGAYLLLLMDAWNHDGLLPEQPALLAAIARVDPKTWPKVWRKIEPLFYKVEGGWRQKRLQKEVENAASKSAKRAAAGSAGGHRRALKLKGARLANATDEPSNCLANARHNSSKRGSMPKPKPESEASKPASGGMQAQEIYLKVREAIGPAVLDPDDCGLEFAVDLWRGEGVSDDLIVEAVRRCTAGRREKPIRKLRAINDDVIAAHEAGGLNSEFLELSGAPPLEPLTFPDGKAGDALRAVVDVKGEKWARAWLGRVEWNGAEVYAADEFIRGRIEQDAGHILREHGYERVIVNPST